MNLNNTQFNILFNKILYIIEEYLDKISSKTDIDWEINYQIMTISFSKHNKIIISKQESLKQIWLASKNQGYHFNYIKPNWICKRTNQNLWNILTKEFFIQGKEKVNFSQNINHTN